MYNNRLLAPATTFLIVAFLFFAFTEISDAGAPMPPINPGCCQIENSETGAFSCENVIDGCGATAPPFDIIGLFEGESCNEQTGLCSGFTPEPNPVPTLSEWGLIAMAGVFGLVGFMVIRRRKAAA